MRFATVSNKPEFGTEEYKKWIEQDDFVVFLRELPRLDEIILYASTPHALLHGVLVPTRLVTPPNKGHLDRWNCTPFSSWGITITGGRRTFEGRQEQQSYVEIPPRLTHPFRLHYVVERNAYCRFDNQGDVEDVIRITEIPFANSDEHGGPSQ